MVDRLGARPLVIQLPVGEEDALRGIIDLVRMVAYLYEDDMGVDWAEGRHPGRFRRGRREAHNQMLEMLADTNEEMMESYLEGGEPTEERVKAAIRAATLCDRAHARALRLAPSRTRASRCCWMP